MYGNFPSFSPGRHLSVCQWERRQWKGVQAESCHVVDKSDDGWRREGSDTLTSFMQRPLLCAVRVLGLSEQSFMPFK